MALSLTKTLLSKAQPGSLTRSVAEGRAGATKPEGKGEPGTLQRELIVDPLERQVAPGARKIISLKPPVDLGTDSANQTTPTSSSIGSRYIGSPGPTQNIVPQDPNAEVRQFLDAGTDLGNRLANMFLGGDRLSSSKKFAKLYNRFQEGGVTRTGHKSVEEMNEAGARQEARRAEEARSVARMNLGGAQREGRVSGDVTTEQFMEGIRTPPGEVPPTPIPVQSSPVNASVRSNQSGEVLGDTSVKQTPTSYGLNALLDIFSPQGTPGPDLVRIQSESDAIRSPAESRIAELDRQIEENAKNLPTEAEFEALIKKYQRSPEEIERFNRVLEAQKNRPVGTIGF